MKLVQSSAPEVVRAITSDGVRASRWINDLLVSGAVANIVAALILLTVGLGDISAAVRFEIPVLVALNMLLFWRARSVRRNWIVAITTDGVFIRLAVRTGRWGSTVKESEVMVFEVPEIVSISASNVRLLFPWARTTKRWLVIEPANALREEVSNRLRSAGCGGMLCGPETEALVADEDGRLAIEWRLYRPALRRFMNEVKREWPSLTVTQERRREVDLIAIWNEPEPYRRQVLAEAKRYGLGAACVFLVMSKRHVSFSQAAAYMAALGGRPAGEEPFASVPAAQPGEVWAATPSSGREPQVSRPSGCAQRDLCPKWAISLVMGVVLAADFALLGHDLKSRILVQAAGLLWLAVLWLPATKRPVGVRQIASLIVFAALAVIVREHPGAAIIADFWSLLVLVTGFGELLLSRPPGTTRWRPLHVTARGLCGAIEHGNTYVSPTVVQEFSAGWEIELSSVTTDRSGHFDLQQVAPAPVHYLAVSHPGMETQYLEVTLTQDAMPLLVRLRPRSG